MSRKVKGGSPEGGAGEAKAGQGGASGSGEVATLELLFADEGAFHTQEVALPAALLDGYPRLIDCLQEDPEVLRVLHLDLGRLCSVRRVG